MTDEEKKAIENIKTIVLPNKNVEVEKVTIYKEPVQDIIKLLNLIEKQEKEINLAKQSLKENANIADERNQLLVENQKKDKMIELMAIAINNYDSQLEINTYRDKEDIIKTFKELAIEYFSKKVGE